MQEFSQNLKYCDTAWPVRAGHVKGRLLQENEKTRIENEE
jgi:hypothetical protein